MTVKPIAAAIAVALALVVTGCVTTKEQQARLDRADQLHRNAPAWFKNYWQQYLGDAAGYAVMAVDRKGRGAAYYYCSDAGCHNLVGAGQHRSWKDVNYKHAALKRCRGHVRQNHPTEKPDCAVYAVRDTIVWEGPVPWEQGYTDPSANRDPIAFTDGAHGEDGLEIHRHAPAWMRNGWRDYLSERGEPRYFAIAPDGSAWGYQTCLVSAKCPDSHVLKAAIRNCEAHTRSDCLIYAHGERVVWEHEFPWYVEPDILREYQEGRGATASAQRTIVSKTDERTFTLSWVGSTDVYRGTMWLEQGPDSGRTYGSLAGRDCEGHFRLTAGNRGEWEVDCGEGWVRAKGEFTGKGHGLGATGTGVDDQGRMVEFVVDAAKH